MGTQQLLLIVLGIIVVGTGVAVGIGIFGSNAEQAQRDAITEHCLLIASAAQGYYGKPAMLGGGENSFDSIEITDCGLSASGDVTTGENIDATFVVEGSGSAFTVTGISKAEDGKSVVVNCDMTRTTDQRLSVSYANW